LLENIYAEFSKTHKVVVAPTGGKIQAVATFMLKCMHPDVHIVYPVVKRFAEDYTDGQQDPVEFAYANFRSFVQGLDRYRIKDLITMKEEVETSLLPTGSQ